MIARSRGKYIIVIGGGLAGLTSAITIAEEDINNKVLLIEKEAVMGGNSAKESSGINGAETNLQIHKGINDTKAKFFMDTYKSSNTSSDNAKKLIGRLVLRSSDAINWLKNNKVIFNEVNILGGHSIARGHRNSNQIHVGSYIINTLVEIAQSMENIKIMTSTSVNKLLKYDNIVVGVRCNFKVIYSDAIILATGGFAYNYDMMSIYRPDISSLPTTNGKWAIGDGITLSIDAGAALIDMEKIQIHPTGFVDIKDKDNKTKYLAAELLRGIGGILLNKRGDRFCNELGTLSHITDAMMNQAQQIKEFLFVIPNSAHSEAVKTIDYYVSNDLLRKCDLQYVAKRYNLNHKSLIKSITQYNKDSTEQGDKFDKRRFPGTPFNIKGEFYVGLVTPTLDYCMGGVKINKNANVLTSNNMEINRLFAAGEVTGGLHGENKLGGNSLLECVVYGRIAGENAMKVSNLKDVDKSIDEYIKNNLNFNSNVDVLQDIDKGELEKHRLANDAWIAIYDKVYDTTNLINNHSGGNRFYFKSCRNIGCANI